MMKVFVWAAVIEAGFAWQLLLHITPLQHAAHTSAPPSPPAAVALSPPDHSRGR